MKFPESRLAHELLDGLNGLEIGGAAHNDFGLNTLNVDRIPENHPDFTPYAMEQRSICGEVMTVNVVAPGDKLPFPDKSFDFVISSHVIEHFEDPIGAIKEWARVARKYVYIICPHRDALPSDREKPLTTLAELWRRHNGERPPRTSDEHYSRWLPDTFVAMCESAGFVISHRQTNDDKVGNGFTVVIRCD
jgi:SAM-dependent methyltransferase